MVHTCGWASDKLKANSFGYVDALICEGCHVEQATGFKSVGMSQSFRLASPEWLTQEKRDGLPFYHQPSQRYYDFVVRDNALIFSRYQLDGSGIPENKIEIQVDYLLGSGNKVVSPLYRTENDELYVLPVNWYSEGGFWEMAPGYEQKHHYGLSRKVQRECMFCHNAYPFEGMERDTFIHRDIFPQTLPEGIDCQRCHGPGEAHVKALLGGVADIETVRNAIVNPAKLPVQERDSVCFQCHMLPAVGLVGSRRFDRGDYSFRPGQKLSEYLIHMDPIDNNISKEQRFEINHHGYRLTSSACFSQSKGALTCISCHNPHKKTSQNEFIKHVDNICVNCHQNTHQQVEFQVTSTEETCVSCHMPQRRTQDVIHAVMTDHRIGIFKSRDGLSNPLKKKEPDLIGLDILEQELKLDALEGDIYRLVSILRAVPSATYARYLKSRLQQSNYSQLIPYMVLIETQVQLKQFKEASETIKYVKHRFGSNSRLSELDALNRLSSGDLEETERIFNWLIEQNARDAELYFNYGLLKYRKQDYVAAFDLFDAAIQLRENFANAAMYKGLSKQMMGQPEAAIQFFKQSLQIEPLLDRSYQQLITIYHNLRNSADAKRYFKLGLRNAVDTAGIQLIAQQPGKSYLLEEDGGE